jgi:proteic killer suppression protein
VESESIRHKALRKLVEQGSSKGVIEPERPIDMLALMVAASGLKDLAIPPNFGFRPLTGNRAGTYAMTVTRNWRLTFTMADGIMVADLDLEDYP